MYRNKYLKLITKGAIFCSIFFCLIFFLTKIFQPLWSNDYYMYQRVENFYETKNETEVVFIGSSHMYCSVNPLLLFQEYGISGYNFSSSGQNSLLNTLYVKETIKEKSPKVIVLDVLGFKTLNISESHHRKGLDAIPNSIDKIETILKQKQYNKLYGFNVQYDSTLSYIFPMLRYHARWGSINRENFVESDISYLHGYVPRYQTTEADFSKYGTKVNLFDQYKDLKENFDDIVSICNKENVKLVLIKTPAQNWREGYSQIIKQWADEKKVPFIDYNLLMEDLNISAKHDFSDTQSHLNDQGATKLTLHLGKYLKDNYVLKDCRDDMSYISWDIDWLRYQQEKAAFFLKKEKDWTKYIGRLQNENYTIFIVAKDNIGGSAHPELVSKMNEIGVTSEINDKKWWSYQAIIDKEQIIYESLSDDPIEYSSDFNGHSINLTSKDWKQGNKGQIQIDGMEYFVDHRGIGIVVYDTVLEKIVDSVTFDLYAGGKAYRN